MKKHISFLIFFSLLVGITPVNAKSHKDPESESQPAALLMPVKAPVFLVVKGVFKTLKQAKATQAFIQQLLGTIPADGIVASEKLEGFPPKKWVIVSVFDSEEKAKWWLHFSDRNSKLPKPYVQKSQVLEEGVVLPYFPESSKDGVQRFQSEAQVLEKINKLADIKNLSKKSSLEFVFIAYPRLENLKYEVEVLQDLGAENSKKIAYDFITVDALNLQVSRYLESLKMGR